MVVLVVLCGENKTEEQPTISNHPMENVPQSAILPPTGAVTHQTSIKTYICRFVATVVKTNKDGLIYKLKYEFSPKGNYVSDASTCIEKKRIINQIRSGIYNQMHKDLGDNIARVDSP